MNNKETCCNHHLLLQLVLLHLKSISSFLSYLYPSSFLSYLLLIYFPSSSSSYVFPSLHHSQLQNQLHCHLQANHPPFHLHHRHLWMFLLLFCWTHWTDQISVILLIHLPRDPRLCVFMMFNFNINMKEERRK